MYTQSAMPTIGYAFTYWYVFLGTILFKLTLYLLQFYLGVTLINADADGCMVSIPSIQ